LLFLAVRILASYYLDLNARRVLRPSFRHDDDEPMVGPQEMSARLQLPSTIIPFLPPGPRKTWAALPSPGNASYSSGTFSV
jgi:hypothetical protein